ncbi:MAG: hypothetical protein ABI298_08815 [Acidimicrobiales bacterium]
MKFLSLKSLAATGALGVAGLGLIGIGAHATFTVSPSSNQVISSGTLAVNASSPSDPSCLNAAANCTNITLTPSTNNGSSFTTGVQQIVLTNVCTLPAYYTSLGITNASGANAFSNEAYLCLTDSNNNVLYNGLFSGASTIAEHDSIPVSAAAGNTLVDDVTVYAGTGSSQCGAVTTPYHTGVTGSNPAAQSLNNDAMGQSIDPTFTFTFTA